MPREFPIVIRKNGKRFIPTFPVELEEGDQIIVAKEMMGTQVPEEQKWLISGVTSTGPVISRED